MIRMWKDNKFQWINERDKHLYIATSGSGLTVFAEEVTYVKRTAQHLVWKMADGKTIRTNDSGYGVGKAERAFIIIRDEPIQFCDVSKGIKTNYIYGVFL